MPFGHISLAVHFQANLQGSTCLGCNTHAACAGGFLVAGRCKDADSKPSGESGKFFNGFSMSLNYSSNSKWRVGYSGTLCEKPEWKQPGEKCREIRKAEAVGSPGQIAREALLRKQDC